MQWEPVIGLEVHVQLNTQSKIFSGASNASNDNPNGSACVIDLGLPGVLPVINAEVIRKAVTFGLAIGAQINKRSVFDRKNYFYPDLPKGYQISQFEDPIVGKGELRVVAENGSERAIGITRAHLEEDAGKSVHDMFANASGIDLNRTGTPLLEIVSEPEITSAKEAAAYFRQLHALVRYLKICDANLADGNMRCDANVSIRPLGDTKLGRRTEIKNINSFKFVERAIEVEIDRQIDILESGRSIVQATMLFDPERDETRIMRTKEDSDDYRYFPDPDLLPIEISDEFVAQVHADLPELPGARAERLQAEQGLSAADAKWLSRDPDIAAYYDAVFNHSADAKLSANWVMGEVSAALNKNEIDISDAPLSPAQLGQLINRIKDGTLSGKLARGLFVSLWQTGTPGSAATVDAAIEEQGLQQVDDTDELAGIIAELIQTNPKQVEQFRAGKDKVLGFFVGQVMKATQGKANPQTVNELLRAALSEKP